MDKEGVLWIKRGYYGSRGGTVDKRGVLWDQEGTVDKEGVLWT